MKEVIITIEEFPSMPNRYNYTLMIDKKRVSAGNHAGNDAGAAAAKAMELAINYSHGGFYCIFAPEKVLAFIPERLRSRAHD